MNTILLASLVFNFALSTNAQPYTCEGPDDLGVVWPSEEILIQFNSTLDGSLYLPPSPEWEAATVMKNLVYNSYFGAAIFPLNTEDVQKAVLFANQYGLRPTVSSSGHDYIGRSSGDLTFQINLSRMRNLDINVTDSGSPTSMSATFQTGLTWIEIYEEVDKFGAVAVGGSAHTVAPGGYILGGGHSPVTRMLGIGVDQVLQFTMVTADGSIVTATENGGTITGTDGSTEALDDGGDLWWSVLGGGGGVYGIITEFKYKLHQPPTGGMVRLGLTYVIAKYGTCVGAATEAIKVFNSLLRYELSNNWGGYLVLGGVPPDDPIPNLYDGSVTFFLNHWGGDEAQARQDMESLINFRPECQLAPADFVVYPTFYEYASTTEDAIYIRVYVVNTLIQEEDLDVNNGFAEFLTTVEAVPVPYMGCTGTLLGGAGNSSSFDYVSVNPAFRTGRMSLSCGAAGWIADAGNTRIAEAMMSWAEVQYQYGTGVYYNEPDYLLEDWKTGYWGSPERYERLLRVKQEWDPENVFWCRHCVGSDLVTHQSDTPCPEIYPEPETEPENV